MKLAFVVPRYGAGIIGGAETAARLLAEHVAARPGWSVEVLTTCATDFVTWADELAPGEEEVGGVRVRRFASAAGRLPEFHPLSAALLADPAQASLADAERWLDLQGPVCPELAEAAVGTDADVVVFYPYLYYPTARVIDRVAARRPTVLHPAAHDVPALFLPVFPRVFAAASGLVFQTTAERELVQRTFPVASHHQLLLGLGVDDPDERRGAAAGAPAAGLTGDAAPAAGRAGRAPAAGLTGGAPAAGRADKAPVPGRAGRAPVPGRAGGLPEEPYLLCLGRVEGHKGSRLLASYFSAYKERRPGPLRLVFAGPVVERPEDHPEIDVLGPVRDDQKWALLKGATAVVSPSPWEAFSLVVAEAWSARRPVVVNAACEATVEHCRRSDGGLSFDGYGEFEAALDRLVADEDLRAWLGAMGRAYVDRNFRWPVIVDRYVRFVEQVAPRA